MSIEYFDVVIIGAGLSGIDVACHLQTECPNKNYVILEGREAMGGTWDLFRYPGIRSDSDMHTLGYMFKPWRAERAIADGESILKYIQETAKEYNINEHIRYSHKLNTANWSSIDAAWTLQIDRDGKATHIQCNFLIMCSGYYRYDRGYTPKFEGCDRFTGEIVHPQNWPQDLDYRDKKVVVIGSGATAVTIVPEMAREAAKVTMLQRSPTYIVSRPERDKTANLLRKLLPEKIAYAITRWKSIAFQQFFYQRTRKEPEKIKNALIEMVRQQLGSDYDVETHFTPSYDPWDQRICLVPNGDLFKAIKSGKAEVVTDSIDTFTENGILLKSGNELTTDIIVTATGLNLLLLGGVEFFVDDRPVEFDRTFTYKGIMYSNVPNLASIFGYVNASWTLRADLMSEYICRIINHLDKKDFRFCTPRLRNEDCNMPQRPFIDGFSSGYLQRVMHLLPKQGDRQPWLNLQNYRQDKKNLRRGAIEDGVLTFNT